MAKVKVFVTDGQTDRQRDEWDLMSPRFRESGGQQATDNSTNVLKNACGTSKSKAWQTKKDGQSDPQVVLCFAGAIKIPLISDSLSFLEV